MPAIDLRFVRLGTNSELAADNRVIAAGTPVFELDTAALKVGDGLTPYVDLPAYFPGNPATSSDPITTAFSTAIPLDAYRTMGSVNQTGALAFTLNASGAKDGGETVLRIVADGSAISVAGFTLVGTGIDATAGKANQVAFYRQFGQAYYAAIVEAGTVAMVFAPNAPTGLTLGTPTSSTLPFTWTASVVNGSGSAATDYEIAYRTPAGSGAYTLFADGVSATPAATITGLLSSTAYGVYVRGINSAGPGPWSAEVTGTTTAAAGAAPVFSAQSAPGGTVGVAYTYTFVASNATSYALASGALPAGLTLSAGGVLSGTPTTAASSTFVVAATGAGGTTNSTSQTVVVAAAGSGSLTYTTGAAPASEDVTALGYIDYVVLSRLAAADHIRKGSVGAISAQTLTNAAAATAGGSPHTRVWTDAGSGFPSDIPSSSSNTTIAYGVTTPGTAGSVRYTAPMSTTQRKVRLLVGGYWSGDTGAEQLRIKASLSDGSAAPIVFNIPQVSAANAYATDYTVCEFTYTGSGAGTITVEGEFNTTATANHRILLGTVTYA